MTSSSRRPRLRSRSLCLVLALFSAPSLRPASPAHDGGADRRFVLELFEELRDLHLDTENWRGRKLQKRALRVARRMVAEDPSWAERAALPRRGLRGDKLRKALHRLLPDGEELEPGVATARRELFSQALLDAVGDPFTHVEVGESALELGFKSAFPWSSGVLVARDEDGPFVELVVHQCEADWRGLRAGDRVVALGDRLASEIPLHRLQDGIDHGEWFTVQRPQFGSSTLRLRARGNELDFAPVQSCMVDEDVGYVTLPAFTGTAFGVRTAIKRLERSGARAIVLDLRGNPGGLIVDGQALADLFLPKDAPIAEFVGREDSDLEDVGLDAELLSRSAAAFGPQLPLVVLVDENSASASEMVTVALQVAGRAKVVGRQSYGKFVAQIVRPMIRGSSAFAPRASFPDLDEGAVEVLPPTEDGELAEAPPVDRPGLADLLTSRQVIGSLTITVARFQGSDGEDRRGIGVTPDLVVERPADDLEILRRLQDLLEHETLRATWSQIPLGAEEVRALRDDDVLPDAVGASLRDAGFDLADPATRRAALRTARRWFSGAHPTLLACPAQDADLAAACQLAKADLR